MADTPSFECYAAYDDIDRDKKGFLLRKYEAGFKNFARRAGFACAWLSLGRSVRFAATARNLLTFSLGRRPSGVLFDLPPD